MSKVIRGVLLTSFIVIILSFLTYGIFSEASEGQINLEDGSLVNWVMDDTDNLTYAITSEGNLHKITHDPLTISKTVAVGTNPTDLYLSGNNIYVALPNTNSIKVVDLTSMEVTQTITTNQEPQQLATDGVKLYYTDYDRIYEMELETGAEVEVVVGDETYSSPSNPDLYVDSETDFLYIAEFGSSGSDIQAMSTIDWSLISESTYEEGYGFPYPDGQLLVDGNDVFYAGHKLNKNNLEEIYGVYDDEFTQQTLTGYRVAGIIGADSQYVYAFNSVFDRNTFRQVGTVPANVTRVLSDGTNRLMYDSSNNSIFLNNDQYTDKTVSTELLNNKLSLNQDLDKWIFDETNNKIYAISTSENQLLIINPETMKVTERRYVGSAPTDIDQLGETLYIALAGSTKIAVTSTFSEATVDYITTKQNPYEVETDGSRLIYAKLDQHVTLYHKDLQSNTEKTLEFYDYNNNTYYEPSIKLDTENNHLYIGESGSSGSNLIVIDPDTGEHIMESDYDNGYGFGYPGRVVLFDDIDIYYAGHRLEKADVTNEKVQLFDNSEEFVSITNQYIFSDKKIYNKETDEMVIKLPSEITVNNAAVNQEGNIYLSVTENDAIYKFDSIEELQKRLVENLTLTQSEEDGSFEFTWNQVTGDGYILYAKHEGLESFTPVTEAPIKGQRLPVTDEMLKDWLGRDVAFGVKAQFGNEESVSMNTIQHTFEIPTPTITDFGIEETTEELSEYGDEAFVLRWENEKLMDGFNVYAYTEDREIDMKFEGDQPGDSELWFTKDQYREWSGKKVYFQVTHQVNGHESEKSEAVSHTFEDFRKNMSVPEVTSLGFEEDSEGEKSFLIRFNLDKTLEAFKVYLYSEDQEIKDEIQFDNHFNSESSGLIYPKETYEKWDGKIIYFQVAHVDNGLESYKTEPVSYNFGKEVEEDPASDNQDASDTEETNNQETEETNSNDDSNSEQNNNTVDVIGEDSESADGGNNNEEQEESNAEEDENEDRQQTVTIKVSKVNETYVVSDDTFNNVRVGDEVKVDLKEDNDSNSSVSFTSDQIKYLKENGNKISIERTTTSISLPSSIFEGKENDTTVHINKLENVYDAISDVYDFTINQGDSTISEFFEPVTLNFNVDPERVQNPDNVKVYYFNEELEEWELIGGTYEDGVVTAETNHFSTYAVFEKEEEEAQEETEEESQTEEEVQEEDKDDSLEETSVNKDIESENSSFNFMWLIVIGILAAVGITIFVRKRKLK